MTNECVSTQPCKYQISDFCHHWAKKLELGHLSRVLRRLSMAPANVILPLLTFFKVQLKHVCHCKFIMRSITTEAASSRYRGQQLLGLISLLF